MLERKNKRLLFSATILLAVFAMPFAVYAAQSNSTNYQVNEVFFGSGGELHACGTAYCSKQSAGDLAVGRFSSNNYQAQAGFNTDRMPYIECEVTSTNVDLGTMDASSTKTTTATFSIKAYLAHGYNVVNASDPPKNNTYTMQNLAVPSASSAGTEQFGINLVANTAPTTFGAAPVQNPDGTFSFGIVSADYSSTNLYKYVKGDAIAYSTSSTSYTDYTIAYIFNVSNLTPGGSYAMNHVLVATATY
jgi:hypothetical protein